MFAPNKNSIIAGKKLQERLHSFKVLDKGNPFFIVSAAIILAFCFIAIFMTPSWGDEKSYHYPNACNFSLNQILMEDSNYSSAYTPFPYALGALALKVYRSVQTLRLLNFLLFLVSILVFYTISKKISDIPFFLTVLFFLNPYLLRSSFLYLMFNYGLTFALTGIYFYFFSEVKTKIFWAHFFWCLAVLSQQWMLVVPLAIYLNDIEKYSEGKLALLVIIKSAFAKILSLAPALALFFKWRGLTHPNFRAHEIHASLEHLNSVLANVGIVFLFLAIIYARVLLKREHVPLLFVLPVLFSSVPAHSEAHGLATTTGLASQYCNQLEKFCHIPYSVSMCILITAGLFIFVLLNKFDLKVDYQRSLLFIINGLCASFIVSTLLGASHIFVIIPFLLLLLHKAIQDSRAIKWLLFLQFYMAAIFYAIYMVFFRSSGYYLR